MEVSAVIVPVVIKLPPILTFPALPGTLSFKYIELTPFSPPQIFLLPLESTNNLNACVLLNPSIDKALVDVSPDCLNTKSPKLPAL